MAKTNGHMLFSPKAISVRYYNVANTDQTGLPYNLLNMNASFVKAVSYEDGLTIIFKAPFTNNKPVYINLDGLTHEVTELVNGNPVTTVKRHNIELLNKEKKTLENATIIEDELYMFVYSSTLEKFVLLSASDRGGIRTFDTEGHILESTTLNDGVLAITLGKAYPGDGKAAFYRIMLTPPATTETLVPVAIQNGLYMVEIKTAMNTTITSLELDNVTHKSRFNTIEDTLGFVGRESAQLTTSFANLHKNVPVYGSTLNRAFDYITQFIHTVYPNRNIAVDNSFNDVKNMIGRVIGKSYDSIGGEVIEKLGKEATAVKSKELDHSITFTFNGGVAGTLANFTGFNNNYTCSLDVLNNSHTHFADDGFVKAKKLAADTVRINLQDVLNDKASKTVSNTFDQLQTFTNNIKSSKMTTNAKDIDLEATVDNDSYVNLKVKDATGGNVIWAFGKTGFTMTIGASIHQYTYTGTKLVIGGSTNTVETATLSATSEIVAPQFRFTGMNSKITKNGDGFNLVDHSGALLLAATIGDIQLRRKAIITEPASGQNFSITPSSSNVDFDATSNILTFDFKKNSNFKRVYADNIESPSIVLKTGSLTYQVQLVSNSINFVSTASLSNGYVFDKKIYTPDIKLGPNDGANDLVIQRNGAAFEFNSLSGITTFKMNKTLLVTGDIQSTSDPRLKQDITPIPLDLLLERINKINLYNFRYKTALEDLTLGVLSTEVKEVFPELVRTDEQGFESVNYQGLAAISIAANKKLNERLTTLEEQVQNLTNLLVSKGVI